MGISGSQLAPTQARFGVARFGATRYGDYRPIVIFKINGTDRASSIRLETVEIDDVLNAEPNRCRFSIRQRVTVTEGMSVVIALGRDQAGTRLFSGTIVTIDKTQGKKGQELTNDVTAIDYTFLLDRRLVTKEYRDLSVQAIVADLVTTYTSGFTATHVQGGFATASVRFVNSTVSAALTQLADLVGASWSFDEQRDLHFFTTEDIASPPTLTDSYTGFWDLAVTTDLSRIRTRAIVEGRPTSTPIAIPAGASYVGTLTFPLEDVKALLYTSVFAGSLRLGAERFNFGNVTYPKDRVGLDDQGGMLSAGVAVGATSVGVTTAGLGLTNAGWARAADQVFLYGNVSGAGTAWSLISIPASGFGSITAAIPIGTEVVLLPYVSGIIATTANSHVINDTVVGYVTVDDAAAQTALAALEGGDGVHEAVIAEGSLDYASAVARGTAELTRFSGALQTIRYKTRHPGTRSGCKVTASLSSPMSLSGTFLIRDVVISGFDEVAAQPTLKHSRKIFPIRTVTASSTQPVRLADLLSRLALNQQGRLSV